MRTGENWFYRSILLAHEKSDPAHSGIAEDVWRAVAEELEL